jgi:hypothetical protein
MKEEDEAVEYTTWLNGPLATQTLGSYAIPSTKLKYCKNTGTQNDGAKENSIKVSPNR